MSLPGKPVQARLSRDAYDALELLADIEGKDLGEKARELLERILLGEAHAAKVAAARFERALRSDNVRESAPSTRNKGSK